MNAVVQMSAPTVELVERRKVRLAYTRKDGWVVVILGKKQGDFPLEHVSRPGGKRVMDYEVLAWADLPPVPETAA